MIMPIITINCKILLILPVTTTVPGSRILKYRSGSKSIDQTNILPKVVKFWFSVL